MGKRFDWKTVDEDLTRKLLLKRYKNEPNLAERKKHVAKMTKSQLAKKAGEVFGTAGIKPRKQTREVAAVSTDLADVLTDHWLPKMKSENLEPIARMLIRRNYPSTKAEKISRLQKRARDQDFKANLFSQFNKAHKSHFEDVDKERTPRANTFQSLSSQVRAYRA